ncbi:hypothetical protein EI94DRAFT_1277081 [Lactarius quietus]|nr:hypothetical protein EI94DRAFT_1277081 [Lactarius quietus]
MDGHAFRKIYSSPSSHTRQRARAPTPRHHSSTQPHPLPLLGDLESPRHSEYSQSRARSSHPHHVHGAYAHPEPSRRPAPSCSSSGLARFCAHRNSEDHLQCTRTTDAYSLVLRSSSHLYSGSSQPRQSKRNGPTGSHGLREWHFYYSTSCFTPRHRW